MSTETDTYRDVTFTREVRNTLVNIRGWLLTEAAEATGLPDDIRDAYAQTLREVVRRWDTVDEIAKAS